VRSTLNGNGPVRASAYADERIKSGVPYAELEALALTHARVPMPAFEKAAEAKDIFIEEMQASLLGFKSPEDAGNEMAARIRKLLPT
jgi:multiple sugar transport system substrate-binding protein